MRRYVLALGATLALAPSAAHAAQPPRRLASAEGVSWLAVSGGQAAYVTTTSSGGATRIAAYLQPLAGGSPRRVFSDRFVPAENVNADLDTTESESVALSPQAIAVASASAQETGVAASGEATLEFGPVGGSRPEVARCTDNEAEPTFDGTYAVAGPRLVYLSPCGPDAGALIVRDVSGAQRTVAPASAHPQLAALNGDELAYAAGGATHVLNLATGAATDIAATGYVGLQADGKLAMTSGGTTCPRTLSWFAAGSPTPIALPGAHPCDLVSMTGDHILFRDDGLALHTVDLSGHDTTLFPVVSYAAEGNAAAVVSGGCAVETLYAVTLDGTTSAPSVPASCPVRVRSRHLRLRGSRLRVKLSCPHGCVGEIGLTRSSSRNSSEIASAEALVVPPHTKRTVVLKLGRAARRALHRGVHRRYLLVTSKPGPVAAFRTKRIRVAITG